MLRNDKSCVKIHVISEIWFQTCSNFCLERQQSFDQWPWQNLLHGLHFNILNGRGKGHLREISGPYVYQPFGLQILTLAAGQQVFCFVSFW